MDNKIKLSWESPFPGSIDYLELSIADGKGYSETIYLPSASQEYLFQNGKHGEMYTFSLKTRFKDGTDGEEFIEESLFLDFSQLPDLPLITINTADGIDPTYDDTIKEKATFPGETITNNEYVTGSMLFIQNGQSSLLSKVKIKIRGNSSSALNVKKSYKIVLDDPMDLLGLGNEFADREWILLCTGDNLNTYIGEYLADLCGAEWAPKMRFINVNINNDWKGLYLLIESVKRSPVRCDVDSTGYLFESDAYWWNSDGKYFTTKHSKPIGFTFKYPKVENDKDTKVILLKNYMEEFENYLYTGDEHFGEYIDVDTFVSWIMVRDILGDFDILGSNRYYYKYDFDPLNPVSSKLKMGPLWDFDACFVNSEDYSSQHSISNGGLYFGELFKYELFYDAYLEKWDEIEDNLLLETENLLTNLYNEQGNALEESRILDAARYRRQPDSVKDEISRKMEYLEIQINWMNNMLRLSEAEE